MDEAAALKWCVNNLPNVHALERLGQSGSAGSRRRADLEKRVRRFYRDDFGAFLNDLRNEDRRHLLGTWADNHAEFWFSYLNSARLQQLNRLLEMMLLDDWNLPPNVVNTRPIRGCEVEAYSKDDEEDEDEGDDEEYKDDDDGEYEDDEYEGDDHEEDEEYEDDFEGLTPGQLIEQLTYDRHLANTRRRPYQDQAVSAILESIDPEQPSLLHVATGGGKTWIANDAVIQWLGHADGPILWITKDWALLWQAARDVCRRHRGMKSKLSRIGGDQKELSALSELKRGAKILYTTIFTLGRRLSNRRFKSLRPSLVVWDECHWGQSGKTGRKILKWCRNHGIPLLGLTATPRPPEHSAFDVVFRKDFPSLVADGYLARPRPELPVNTGIAWSPQRATSHGDFSQSSLTELSRKRRRNELIVDHYAKNREKYGKTIVFACNIDHADKLADLFHTRRGVAARPIHSRQDTGTNQRNLEDFRSGRLRVLVNVAKLTHGIDVPDARTVFLCRPTLSDILFSQMVGRAARRTDTEHSFFIVEFTDNMKRLGADLVTAKDYFEGAGFGDAPRASAIPPDPRQAPHRPGFDPLGAPRWFPHTDDVDDALQGLWYREGQTFGIEFELTSDDVGRGPDRSWMLRAQRLLDALRDHLPDGAVADHPFPEYKPDKNMAQWNVEWDASCGWEVTSRILRDDWGYEELLTACSALSEVAEEVGLRVNYRTGTHVHFGWLGNSPADVRRAIELARLFEPAVATLVSPSRLASFDGRNYDLGVPNEFCQPVSTVFSADDLEEVETMDHIWDLATDEDARYVSFNVRPLDQLHTVEVRLHNGTVDGRKVALWVSLWQQILWRASAEEPIPLVDDTDCIEPHADIVELAHEHLPAGEEPAFLAKLDARREQITDIWHGIADLEQWAEYSYEW